MMPARPLSRTGSPLCAPAVHRHCARCGVRSDADPTVAATVVKDGPAWPALCSGCSAKMRRIAAVERAVGRVAIEQQ